MSKMTIKIKESENRVHQFSFDFLVDGAEPSWAELQEIEKEVRKAVEGIKGISVVGAGLTDASWSQKEYGLGTNESRKLRESDNDFVGKQKFTYGELKKAWDELHDNIKNDPFDSKNPPSGGYDIRNGYSYGDRGWKDWDIDFSLEAITKEIESVPELIRAGDLEVYYNDNDAHQADSDEHGILIEDGKIATVY